MKDEKANKMYEEYQKGFSLSEVGKMFGVTRQSVFCMFKSKRRNFKLRGKISLPYQYFNNIKFTPQSNGYYRKSHGDRKLMHRYVWEFYNVKIPLKYDIHHKDRNRANNKIENLELMKKSEHSRKYATGNNQYTKNRKKNGK